MESTVDRWLQDDVIDIDSQRTGGLLELSLPGWQQDHREHAAAAA
jgi:CyaY protein